MYIIFSMKHYFATGSFNVYQLTDANCQTQCELQDTAISGIKCIFPSKGEKNNKTVFISF